MSGITAQGDSTACVPPSEIMHWGMSQPCLLPAHVVPQPTLAVASQEGTGWHEARLKALESRLATVEGEHRAEVTSLRHALEECVCAIGMCARAIDTMCVDAGADCAQEPCAVPPGAVPVAPRGPEPVREWERAAAALHDAANLGRRALGCARAGSARGLRPRAPAQRGLGATPVAVEVVGSTMVLGPQLQAVAEGRGRQPLAPQQAAALAPRARAQPALASWGSMNVPAPPPALQGLLPPGNLLGSIPGLPQVPLARSALGPALRPGDAG